VSEQTFIYNFQSNTLRFTYTKTTTIKHVLIRTPPPFWVQTNSSSCPPSWWGMSQPRVQYSSVPSPRAEPPANPFPPPPPPTENETCPPLASDSYTARPPTLISAFVHFPLLVLLIPQKWLCFKETFEEVNTWRFV
jgi:hypothetical protein